MPEEPRGPDRRRGRRTGARPTRPPMDQPPIQLVYADLAGRLILLSWSVPDVFPERERDLWEYIVALGERRGLPTAPLRRPADARPAGEKYREGVRQTYRELSAELDAMASTAGEAVSDQERAVWWHLWAFGAAREVVESIMQ